MELKFVLTAFVFISATVTRAEYIRPQPRRTLEFPWHPKPSSHPQQVISNHFHFIILFRKNIVGDLIWVWFYFIINFFSGFSSWVLFVNQVVSSGEGVYLVLIHYIDVLSIRC